MENKEGIPRHVGIVMDGNGRWAKERGLPRIMGHHAGVRTVEEIGIVPAISAYPIFHFMRFQRRTGNDPKEK